jgi:hypothetical protein
MAVNSPQPQDPAEEAGHQHVADRAHDQCFPGIVAIAVCEIAEHATALHVDWAGVVIFKNQCTR